MLVALLASTGPTGTAAAAPSQGPAAPPQITSVSQAVGASALGQVACPDSTHPGSCLAVGTSTANGGVLVPISGDLPGDAVPVPGTTVLPGVACSSPTSCVAVGRAGVNGVVVPILGGVVGPVETVAGTDTGLQAVACPTATSCLAVGEDGQTAGVVPITNGMPGMAQPVPGASELSDIACLNAHACVAVGYQQAGGDTAVVVPVFDGVAGAPIAVPGMLEFAGVACPSPTACLAVGISASVEGALVTISDGTISAVQGVAGTVILLGVACATATVCEAVGAQSGNLGMVVPISGGVAGPAQQVPGSAGLARAACPAVTTCLAEGESSSTQAVSVQVTTPIPATFSHPLNGGINVDPATPFSWSASPDADGYILVVGTTHFGTDLLNSGVLPATTLSYAVPTLPPGVLYATLLTRVAGHFLVYDEVTFTASSGSAHFTYPVGGQIGVDTTRPFTWLPVTQAQAYILVVGTKTYGTDLANSGVLPPTTTSYAVPRLPPGVILHATLLTKARGVWVNFQAITFTAAPR